MTEPKGFFNQLSHSPAVAAGLFCCLCTAALAAAIMVQTQGLFVYPLDDSYIHLALARTLALHHVWGMGPAEFASASSSPGWTIILAASDLIFGSHLVTPVFLNLILVFCLLIAADYGLTTFAPAAPRWIRVATPFALVLGTPLPTLTLLGMEHVAQAFSVLLLVVLATKILAANPRTPLSAGVTTYLLVCAAFAEAIRYEAIFTVAPILLLLAWRRRFILAICLALCSAIGPIGFGLYSHHLSGFWLPFSVLAKQALNGSMRNNLHSRIKTLATWSSGIPLLWTLLPLWLLRCRSRSFWEPAQLLLLLTLALSVTHMLVAPIGWLMRYDSYFVCLSLYAICLAGAATSWPTHLSEAFLALPLWNRTLTGVFAFGILWLLPSLARRINVGSVVTVKAAVDRYNEHIQMARFAATSYDHDTIVVDDLGAVAYYSNARLLDMIGLGSVEPLLMLRQGRPFNVDDMARWATEKDASIAILQSGQVSIRALTPKDWKLVQTWHLPRNRLFDDYDVSFYAIRPGEAARLCTALNKFTLTPNDKITINTCQH